MAPSLDAPVRRVMVVYGTRPEAIKMAPLIEALAAADRIRPYVVVTGQHREMLDQVNQLFGIVPEIDLDILRPGQQLTDITTAALSGVNRVIRDAEPDALVVQGDTTTAFAAALAAFYEQTPVVHLEAGLRTDDRYSPFPEEINRRLVTQLTTLHLAPTAANRDNLTAEGVSPDAIAVTGNTVIDALLGVAGREHSYGDPELEKVVRSGRRILLVTTHRRESWGERMRAVAATLAEVARERDEVHVVLPMHRNPVVRTEIEAELGGLGNVMLCDPLPYADFAHLMKDASIILTDSGGLQEEAPSLGKPVLLLRDNTERREAVAAGTVRPVGTDPAAVRAALLRLLDDDTEYARMANAANPFGDGRAAKRCAAAIAALLGVGERQPTSARRDPPPRGAGPPTQNQRATICGLTRRNSY